jgi:hypothetical protein
MRTSVPLTRATAKGDVAVQKKVGEPYRALDWFRDWFRDSILNENRDEVGAALKSLRDDLTELEAMISWNR